MDVDAIEPGLDFVEVLGQKVDSSDVLLALIGPRWLNAPDGAGRRRLDNSSDFVRLEIEAALRRNIRVIPVLLDGAALPKEDNLPISLRSLATRQAVRLTHERFAADAEGLVQSLARVVKPTRQHASSVGSPRSPWSAAESVRSRLGGRLAALAYALFAVPARGVFRLTVQYWPALALSALGLLSGVLSATVGSSRQPTWLDPASAIFFLPGSASEGPRINYVLIGASFGIVVAVSLWIKTRNWWALPLLPVAVMYSWSAAVCAATFSALFGSEVVASLIAGAVGATGTHLSCALCSPDLRRPRWIAITCAVGAAAGTLFFMGRQRMIDERLLYVIWQPAVAFCLGLGLGREKNAGYRLPMIACGYALLAFPGFYLSLVSLPRAFHPWRDNPWVSHLAVTLPVVLIVALGAYLRASRGLAVARSEVVLYWTAGAVPLANVWFMLIEGSKWSFLGPDRYFASGAAVAGIAAMAGLALMLIDLRRHKRARDAASQGEGAARLSESASAPG
jgi:hypothetical protein